MFWLVRRATISPLMPDELTLFQVQSVLGLCLLITRPIPGVNSLIQVRLDLIILHRVSMRLTTFSLPGGDDLHE